MIPFKETRRVLDLISELRYCGSRAEAEAIGRGLIEIGPSAGNILSRVSHDGWNSTLAVELKVKVLGEVGPAHSVPFLIDTLRGKHPGIRRRSAEALYRLCDRAKEDAGFRRKLQRRVKAARPVLRQLTETKYVGSNLPTEPYRRALMRIDQLLSFETDRELPIPHAERVGNEDNLPIASSIPQDET